LLLIASASFAVLSVLGHVGDRNALVEQGQWSAREPSGANLKISDKFPSASRIKGLLLP
jgi:hypothetical protein